MIYAYTGLGGSGKTYQMVKTAHWYWKRGINIYTNTKLLYSKYPMDDQRKGTDIIKHPKDFSKLEHLIFRIKRLIKPNIEIKKRGKIFYYDQIEEIQSAKDGIVLFDEGQVLFNSGAWKEISDEFKYKVSQERKHDLDFFTTTRRFRSILIDYRQEIHEWRYHKELIAIKWGPRNRKRIIIGLYIIYKKDMEAIREDLPDRDTPNTSWRLRIIHCFSRRLYDTKYDIGFTPIKMVTARSYNNLENIWQKSYLIIPKRLSLKDALNAIYTMSRTSSPMKSKTSSKNTKSFA